MVEIFWSTLQSPNVIWVLIGASLLGMSAGVLGTFAFLGKRALVGDTIAHAALPGVTSAFLLFQSRDPFVMVSGALVSSFVGVWSVEWMKAHTKIKEDSALAIVLSVFFAIGVFQLTLIQKLPLASQAGLDKLLFGQAASLVRSDLFVLAGMALISLISVVLFMQRFAIVIFDRNFCRTVGVRVRTYEIGLAFLIVLSVVIGLQLVGVVLMAALMITPAAAARYWTDRLKTLLVAAGLIGALSGMCGALISCAAPRMPTGPWMVVVVTFLFAVSLIFAPRRGILRRLRRRASLRARVYDENVLRTLYKIGEDMGEPTLIDPSTVLQFRNMRLRELEIVINRLCKAGSVKRQATQISLTPQGYERAARVTRVHRLWELYLTKNINIPPDHAHLNAEEIEHVLTPELEAQLAAELGAPTRDPHGRAIPQ